MSNSFLIGPIPEGLRKDIKPFATPEDSFQTLINVIQYRGRLIRRTGYELLGRLANGTPVMGLRTRELFGLNQQDLIAFDLTTSYRFNSTTRNFDILTSAMAFNWSGTNYQFFFTTNYAGGFWATNNVPGLNGQQISGITKAASAVVTTVNPNGFSLGQTVTFVNVPGMIQINGLSGVITNIGSPTQFTVDIDTSGFTVYSGGPGGIALNSQVAVADMDGIKYYGTLVGVSLSWANYNPPIDDFNALAGALLIFPYRGYLVFLSTWEGNDSAIYNYQQRARWNQYGTPYYSQPVPSLPTPQTADPQTMRSDLFGKGGFSDAPTQECIIGAEFVRDLLVVYFERSTWRLRFINNEQDPFVWERVNVELSSGCTFSTIAFDKGIMGIGNRGIVISDGYDTSRFDEKIPDDIFDIRKENNGFQRVYGIRSFRTRLCYWTFPSVSNPLGTFPDLVLIYNYETKNWAYYDDCFTCFGYFYETGSNQTWNSLTRPWSSYGDDETWGSGQGSVLYESIVAGNQQGFVLWLEQGDASNDPSLAISAIAGTTFTSTNNNLPDGTWVTLSGITGTTEADGTSLNGRNFKLANPSLVANTFSLYEFRPISCGMASGTSYTYDVGLPYAPIIPGSVYITVGSLVFQDNNSDGFLFSSGSNSGGINYATGVFTLNFNPSIGSTAVIARFVGVGRYNGQPQGFSIVTTTGAYGGGGLIAKISNITVETKYFNFFKNDKSARLSQIDFYTDNTNSGEFTCNVLADSSTVVANAPLNTPSNSILDNPRSNVVLTYSSQYQIGTGDASIYRLYADVRAQTFQLQLTMTDQQLAVNRINASDIVIQAMIVKAHQGGRII